MPKRIRTRLHRDHARVLRTGRAHGGRPAARPAAHGRHLTRSRPRGAIVTARGRTANQGSAATRSRDATAGRPRRSTSTPPRRPLRRVGSPRFVNSTDVVPLPANRTTDGEAERPMRPAELRGPARRRDRNRGAGQEGDELHRPITVNVSVAVYRPVRRVETGRRSPRSSATGRRRSRSSTSSSRCQRRRCDRDGDEARAGERCDSVPPLGALAACKASGRSVGVKAVRCTASV